MTLPDEQKSTPGVIFHRGVNESILLESCKAYASVEFISGTVFVEGFESNHFHQPGCIDDRA